MTVLIETKDRVMRITLNDPGRRNTVTAEMNEALVTAVAEAEADSSVGAIVITGAGRAFCAGGHLDDLLSATSQEELAEIYEGFLAVANSSVPTVAAVNGPAVGAGMNLLLACDLVIAAESAMFDSRFHQIAIHSGGGHIWRLANLTNVQTAKAMVLFGQRFSGLEAAEVGLAWKCVPNDDLLPEAHKFASIAAGTPKGLNAKTKDTFNALATVDSGDQAVQLEVGPQFWSMQQPEFALFVKNLKAAIADRGSR